MLPLGCEDAEHLGAGDRLALVDYIFLAVDMVRVLLHCAGGDKKTVRDLLNAQSLSQQFQNFELAIGQ